MKEQIGSRNLLCAIPSCGNWGGRGFRRSGISKHVMGQHPTDLKRTSPNYLVVTKFWKPLDSKICVACNKITMRYTANGCCDKCDKKRPAAGKLTMDLTAIKRESSRVELMSIQETKFSLRAAIPRKLCTLWSDLFIFGLFLRMRRDSLIFR